MTPDEKQAFHYDLIQKMITRTDGFHNYANTKSTIIITFITAIIAAIGAHTGHAIDYIKVKNHSELIVLFKIFIFIAIMLLLTSFSFVGRTVMPYIKPSKKKNFFSFVDTINSYSSEESFLQDIESMNKDDVIKSMTSLQYNLSAGLIIKYQLHQKAIIFILISFIPLFLNLLIILFV